MHVLQLDNPHTKLVMVINGLQTGIEQECNCSFTLANITGSRFQCFRETNRVTFRARIYGTDTTVMETISCLQMWIADPRNISIMNYTLTLETCNLTIESFSIPGCQDDDEREFTCSSDDSFDVVSIASGASLITVIVVLSVVVIIMAVIIARRLKTKRYKLTHSESQ